MKLHPTFRVAEWTQGKLWKHGDERGELKGEMFEESPARVV